MNNWVPNWNYQSQVEGEERKRSFHVLMDNQEVTELTWENGQLAKHEFSGLLSNEPTWINKSSSDTLESIVHQATSSHSNSYSKMLLSHPSNQFDPANTSSDPSFSFEKSIENSKSRDGESRTVKKRMRLEPDRCRGDLESGFQGGLESASAGGSATFSRENDLTAMRTWTSTEGNLPSLKVKTADEDSACHEGSEDMDQEQRGTKGETSRSNSTRRNRAAENHNESERRRRDRINQKMKALQRLVPNASKNDKASMLDEVIAYLKQLQAQVKTMNARSLPQMMPALAMQQQMQMALLARMGMGVGLTAQSLPQVVGPTQIASAVNSSFFSPPFVMPPMIPNHSPNATAVNNMATFNNPYSQFFAQPMNMDLYNKMATIYQQQMMNQSNQPTSNPLPHNNVQEG